MHQAERIGINDTYMQLIITDYLMILEIHTEISQEEKHLKCFIEHQSKK
jgi:hypothetical protein